MSVPPSTPHLIPPFPPSWAETFGEDDRGIFAECSVRDVSFAWRWVMPGKFLMGSPEAENFDRGNESPQHEVILIHGFWMGETPVTQAQWEAVTGENPSHFKGLQRPVEIVSWHKCRDFAGQLNQLLPGLHAALPSEAQWEYACRAGTTGAYHDGSPCTKPSGKDPALDALGWFDDNSGNESHDVRKKKPNAWGLYDMHGNVWEWCRDAWDEHAYKKRQPPALNPESRDDSEGALRVLRGGSWLSHALDCRASIRSWLHPGFRGYFAGLRLSAGQPPEPVRAAEPPGAERPVQG